MTFQKRIAFVFRCFVRSDDGKSSY